MTYTSDKWSSEEISEMIPYFNNDDVDGGNDTDNNLHLGMYKGGDYQMLIKQLDFSNNDDEYSVFIITALNQMIPQIKHFIIQGIIAIVCILIITGIILIFWIYGSILKPV